MLFVKALHALADWRRIRPALKGSLGFVPTMGALHAGHAALLKRCVRENDLSVASIFVNPAQFNDPEDLASYPDSLEEDLKLCASLGMDYVLIPSREEIYADGGRYRIEETQFSRELCGAHRPGHFAGVLSVVMKLLNLVRPERAYFGEKDYQQYLLVRDMAAAFFLDTEILPCETVRAEDGLALSSRNARLGRRERKLAARLNALLRSPRTDGEIAEQLAGLGFSVDYVATRFGRRFAAASLPCPGGAVRLIDNAPL